MGKSSGPELSIITPFYNEGRHIREYIQSLFSQEFISWELLLIDDGSTDESSEIAREYANNEGGYIAYFRLTHGGPGVARNFGARQARGRILVFLDADMILPPHYLTLLTKPIRSGKAKATTHARELAYNAEKFIARTFFHTIRCNLLPGSYSGVARAIQRRAFLDAHGFDPSLGYFDDKSPVRALVVSVTCYHNNPETIGELWRWAWWVLKSKLGVYRRRKT